jgi:uncharacterized protein (DUF342 family)
MPSNLLEISRTMVSGSPPIRHDGSILVKGNVEPDCIIDSEQDIEIVGDVFNSKIRSENGNVTVRGGIRGVSSFVFAGGDVLAQYAQNASIKAYGNITIDDFAFDSRLMAKKSVHIEKGEGRLEGGDIEAGLEIITNSIGNSKKKPTSVKLTNFRQSDLYGFLLKFEKEHGELSRQIAGLEKIIEVIRIIGAKVTSLPLEKKQELAAKVRQYNDFLLKRIKLEDEKKALLEADKSSDDLDRVIIAKQSIFGGVTVTIDRSVSLIQESYEKVILYKKGIIIIGNFDEFMNRKKYA